MSARLDDFLEKVGSMFCQRPAKDPDRDEKRQAQA